MCHDSTHYFGSINQCILREFLTHKYYLKLSQVKQFSLSLCLIASMQSKTNSYMIYFLEISYEKNFPIKIQKKNYDGSMIKEEMINDTN